MEYEKVYMYYNNILPIFYQLFTILSNYLIFEFHINDNL